MLVVLLVVVQYSSLQMLQRLPVNVNQALQPPLSLHESVSMIPKESFHQQFKLDEKYSRSMIAADSHNNSLGPYCLVHVGKTAGGTLSCRFGSWLAKNCKKQQTKNQRPSVLSKHVLGKIHKNRDWGCMKRNIKRPMLPAVWLFTLRHPLDRIVSWFHYEHLHLNHSIETVSNRPALYDDCYDDMNDLAQIGLKQAWEYQHSTSTNTETLPEKESPGPNMSPRCAKRAWNAITGKVGYEYHNFYNYRYYRDWVDHVMGPTNYTILVIRSEHLEEDWSRLEELYTHNHQQGSTNMIVDKGKQRDDYFATVQRHKTNSSLLSPDSYLNLCRALCQEIQIYSFLLKRAINLTPQQLEQSMDELHAKCPPMNKCENPPILQFYDDVRVFDTPNFPRK
jgi:hypothetical protein